MIQTGHGMARVAAANAGMSDGYFNRNCRIDHGSHGRPRKQQHQLVSGTSSLAFLVLFLFAFAVAVIPWLPWLPWYKMQLPFPWFSRSTQLLSGTGFLDR